MGDDVRQRWIEAAAKALFDHNASGFPVPPRWERVSAMRQAVSRDQVKAAIAAYEAAALEDGRKMVARELTKEMKSAVYAPESGKSYWHAMWDAAPSPGDADPAGGDPR